MKNKSYHGLFLWLERKCSIHADDLLAIMKEVFCVFDVDPILGNAKSVTVGRLCTGGQQKVIRLVLVLKKFRIGAQVLIPDRLLPIGTSEHFSSEYPEKEKWFPNRKILGSQEVLDDFERIHSSVVDALAGRCKISGFQVYSVNPTYPWPILPRGVLTAVAIDIHLTYNDAKYIVRLFAFDRTASDLQ